MNMLRNLKIKSKLRLPIILLFILLPEKKKRHHHLQLKKKKPELKQKRQAPLLNNLKRK
jgi:hypothetical protein